MTTRASSLASTFALAIALGASACAQHASSEDRARAEQAPSAAALVPLSSSASPASSSLALPTSWAKRAVPSDGPRVFSKSRFVNVFASPTTRTKPIGWLWVGGSVKLHSTEPVRGPGCAKLYAIEPRGYVCVDGEHATLDANDAIYQRLLEHAPDPSSPWPYLYGESQGALKNRFLVHTPQPKWPRGLQDPRDELAHRSTVAWTTELDTKKRTFLVTSDLSFVAKDRVEPYPRVGFHGVMLGASPDRAHLPLAFFRRVAHAKHRRDGDARFSPTGASWERLSHVELTGKSETSSDKTYWETKDGGAWLEAADAGIVLGAKETPWKSPVRVDAALDANAIASAAANGSRRTWIEVSARHGWLVAYENDVPVFTTMISAGKLGAAVPRATAPMQPPATTPIGSWPLRAKFVTTTMAADLESGEEFVHSEVPWSQHFFDKYLLHTAYWHDAWGEGKSGGCVNLAPIDAKWLFDWSEPRVPDGWHAYLPREGEEPATTIVIHS